MSQPLTPKLSPATYLDSVDWAGRVRSAIIKDGQALRRVGCTIEAKSLHDNQWRAILLPTGTPNFATPEVAQEVLNLVLNRDG